jgi:hypothetical protein
MKLPVTRDQITLGLTLLVLAVTSAYLGWTQSRGVIAKPLEADSNLPDGGRALALWLTAQGYHVSLLEYQDFGLSPDTDVLLVLAPSVPFDRAELAALDRWLEHGGTLLLAVEPPSLLGGIAGADLLDHFDAQLQAVDPATDTITLAQPLLTHPALAEPIRVSVQIGLEVDDPTAVVYAYRGDVPVLVHLKRGDGQVWLTTLSLALHNSDLRYDNNARLVFNLLANSPGARTIVFDEVHHGRALVRESLDDWLRNRPAGHAILFVAGALFVYVIVSGRRFGRPLPPPQLVTRRAPEEYILAMANLFRRGGLRDATARHYHDRLKRALGQPYRLDPRLGDPDFVAELARYRENLDGAALLRLLRDLSRGGLSEAELLRLAREADRWGRRDR